MSTPSFIMALLLISSHLYGQGVKTLNAYVDYANQSADEMTAVFSSVSNYYPKLFEKSSWNQPRYVCPIQIEEYYYNKAIQAPVVSTSLLKALKDLNSAAAEIDKKCKELDTYHKLEDYKTDKFAAALRMINEMQPLFLGYHQKQNQLATQLAMEFKKIGGAHSYNTIAATMTTELVRERDFLSKWKFNLKEEVHTGWIVDELQKSITDTDAAIKRLKDMKPVMKYPASSMWPSFLEGLESILELKRRALDEYNFEARKSDKHKNDVYLSLINYFNGVLHADYNTFLNFASGDGYSGLKAIKFIPLFTIDEQAKENQVSITPFSDVPRTRPSPPKQSSPVSRIVYKSLVNYVDLINETWRQVSNHRDVIRNLNSSASYYASLTSYVGKGGLSFKHDNFEVPLSHYQKAVAESKSLSPALAASLNAGTEVLINILKEMDEIGAVLEQDVSAKKYQEDRVKRVYELLGRTHELFQEWDARKEILFEDVQRIYDSYPVGDAASSWNVSGKALRELTALDHDGLFRAKGHYRNGESGPIETAKIDAKLREVISQEYDNMKGIEKYGRNNGLCPYTPYEDLPKNSKTLSEYLQALKPAKGNVDSYQHPYHSMVYIYNEVVDDYNKFCELSPAPLLPYVKQPELFILVPPQEEKQEASKPAVEPSVQRTQQQEPPHTPTATAQNDKPVQQPQPRNEVKLLRDTVYIEKRDTVWMHDPSENLRSMEGYATNNMVLLLDVSGSMNAPERLPLLKKSVLDMLSMMRSEDQISIVVFSGKPKVLLPATSFKDESKITKAINSLQPSGKTDGIAGLKLAYKVADENYIRGGNNRIVLATDGEFPINEDTEALIGKFSREDIFLSVFNFGKKTMNARNLEKITSLGKGNYEFVSRENVDIKLIGEAKAKRKK
jgi:Ca-activated chloride channel family protein